MDKQVAASVPQYIAAFPPATRKLLSQLRATIRKVAPDAEEVISYGMPSYNYKGRKLIYFAGYARHIGFYPMAAAIIAFKKQISIYKNAKGSIQFPLDQPLPVALVTAIVKFR